jgi:hypothetical protein
MQQPHDVDQQQNACSTKYTYTACFYFTLPRSNLHISLRYMHTLVHIEIIGTGIHTGIPATQGSFSWKGSHPGDSPSASPNTLHDIYTMLLSVNQNLVAY